MCKYEINQHNFPLLYMLCLSTGVVGEHQHCNFPTSPLRSVCSPFLALLDYPLIKKAKNGYTVETRLIFSHSWMWPDECLVINVSSYWTHSWDASMRASFTLDFNKPSVSIAGIYLLWNGIYVITKRTTQAQTADFIPLSIDLLICYAEPCTSCNPPRGGFSAQVVHLEAITPCRTGLWWERSQWVVAIHFLFLTRRTLVTFPAYVRLLPKAEIGWESLWHHAVMFTWFVC